MGLWAREVGSCPTQLANYCRLSGARPKTCLDFARLLRVALKYAGDELRLEYLLDVSDPRTLRNLIGRAGLTNLSFPRGAPAFIESQLLLRDPVLLNEIARFVTSTVEM